MLVVLRNLCSIGFIEFPDPRRDLWFSRPHELVELVEVKVSQNIRIFFQPFNRLKLVRYNVLTNNPSRGG